MSRLFPATSRRSRGRVGLIIAVAAGVLVGLTLLPASHADNGAPEPVVDGCTVTLPEKENYSYQHFGDILDPGAHDLGRYYPELRIDIVTPNGAVNGGPKYIDVPFECGITVTAQCEDVTFKTTLVEDWWPGLSIKYGAADALTETAEFDGTDTVTVPFTHDPLAYEVLEGELGETVTGTVSPNCPVAEEPIVTTPPPADETPEPEPEDEAPKAKDEAPVPTVAPSSGM